MVVPAVKCIVLGTALVFLTGCDDSGSAPDIVQTIAPPAVTAPAPPAAPPTPTPAATNCAPQSGSFQLTASGFTNDTVGTALYKYFPCEYLAQIFLPAFSGPSNADEFTASPLPSFLIPQTIAAQEHLLGGFDNDVEQSPISVEIFAGDSTLHFLRDGEQTGWTPSGSKGVGLQVITVFLN